MFSNFNCCNYNFQLLYAGEGEATKPEETPSEDKEKPTGTVMYKGHELVAITFHMPTTCEVCPKPLWHMFRPPSALACTSKLKNVNCMASRFSFVRSSRLEPSILM